jgi:hypothetical protein
VGIALGPTVAELGIGGSKPHAIGGVLGTATGLAVAVLITRPWQAAIPIATATAVAAVSDAAPAATDATPTAVTATEAHDASTSTAAVASNSALLEEIRSVKTPRSPFVLLMVSFLLFFWAAGAFDSPQHVIILAIVLALHEAGHALGMKVFGYQRLDPSLGGTNVPARAEWIRLAIDRAISFRHSPGVLASTGLVIAWGGGVLTTLVGLVAMSRGG